MSLPVHFSTLHGGNQPLSLFDRQFAAVANLTMLPCDVSSADGNALMLMPRDDTPTQHRYVDLQPTFVFTANQTNTGAVTINVAGVQHQHHHRSGDDDDWDPRFDPQHGGSQPPGSGWPRPPAPMPLGARPAFKNGGLDALSAGDIVQGAVYTATFAQALNGGSGGFVVSSAGASFAFPTAWTPTITSANGPYGASGANGAFTQLGHLLFFTVDISVSAKGGGGGALLFSVPPRPVTLGGVGVGRDQATGDMGAWQITSGASNGQFATFDNTDPIVVVPASYILSGFFGTS